MNILGFILIAAVLILVVSTLVWIAGTITFSITDNTEIETSARRRKKRLFHEWCSSVVICSLFIASVILLFVAGRSFYLAW